LFSENLSIVIGPNLLWSNDGSPVSAGMEIVNSVSNEKLPSKSESYRVIIHLDSLISFDKNWF
jgi:hypothetical protein